VRFLVDSLTRVPFFPSQPKADSLAFGHPEDRLPRAWDRFRWRYWLSASGWVVAFLPGHEHVRFVPLGHTGFFAGVRWISQRTHYLSPLFSVSFVLQQPNPNFLLAKCGVL